ncbi:hypothetical protein [Cryobacterium sp. 5B3]|uniref:hypothetical protein n=1 Tax=Cryobacterium sp. 5B3 TaxID=3048586 RepID=UPI002AB558B1|nr:hypothetical protein [Cryobacterium sp. 5B3]MDY7544511.1 hypothetical protein [Cryobacterium sp. 5B3]MEB0276503.1 hypothetical protein [Cryobacterium sp. 5B3]
MSIMVHDPGLAVGDSLVGTSTDDILAKLTPAAAALFTKIQNATPAQINWPATPARAHGAEIAACSSFLKTTSLARALGVATIPEYANTAPGPTDIVTLESTALSKAGFIDCGAEVSASARAGFYLLLNNAAVVDRIAASLGPDSQEHVGKLSNQVGAEKTVSNCSSTQTACDLWFTLGDDAIFVSSTSSDSTAIAKAIIDQAR